MKVKLWSINRWLRCTGIRLAVVVDLVTPAEGGDRKPTELELFWAGLPDSKDWKQWEL